MALFAATVVVCLLLQPLVAAPHKPKVDLSGTTWSIRGAGKLKGRRFRQQKFVGKVKQAFDQSLVCGFRADGSFVLEDGHGELVGEGTWARRGKKVVLDLASASASGRSGGPGSILGGVPSPAGVGVVDVQSWSMRCSVKTDKRGRSTLTCVSKFKVRLEGEYLSYELSGKAKARGPLVQDPEDSDAAPLPLPVPTRVSTTPEEAIAYLRDGQAVVTLDAEIAADAEDVESEWVKASGPRGDVIDSIDGLPADVTVIEEGVYSFELRLLHPDGNESIAARTAIEVRGPVSAPSARLSWTPPWQNEDGSILRNLAGFRIYYGLCVGPSVGSCQSEVHEMILDAIDVGRSSSVTIPNLESGETYFFFVTSYNSTGVESDFSPVVFKTVP